MLTPEEIQQQSAAAIAAILDSIPSKYPKTYASIMAKRNQPNSDNSNTQEGDIANA